MARRVQQRMPNVLELRPPETEGYKHEQWGEDPVKADPRRIQFRGVGRVSHQGRVSPSRSTCLLRWLGYKPLSLESPYFDNYGNKGVTRPDSASFGRCLRMQRSQVRPCNQSVASTLLPLRTVCLFPAPAHGSTRAYIWEHAAQNRRLGYTPVQAQHGPGSPHQAIDK